MWRRVDLLQFQTNMSPPSYLTSRRLSTGHCYSVSNHLKLSSNNEQFWRKIYSSYKFTMEIKLQYTLGSQNVPRMIILHCNGTTYGNADFITFGRRGMTSGRDSCFCITLMHRATPRLLWAIPCQEKPPYCLDLTPGGFRLYPTLKKRLEGTHFSIMEDTKSNAVAELRKTPREDLCWFFKQWHVWCSKCVHVCMCFARFILWRWLSQHCNLCKTFM
jgi:hypothetical protein